MSAPAAAGSSFYAGMRVLPKAEREAMYAIYAFCRAVDDIADDHQSDRAARAGALDQWRSDMVALYEGRPAGRAEALRPAVEIFGARHADFVAVIDGMAMDVIEDIRWPSAAKLDLYCDRVASAVGRLSIKVFGMDEVVGDDLSHHLGRALQLTNILRDIDEDAAIDRVYLPREALEAEGIVFTTPQEVVARPEIDAASRPIANEALMHFSRANEIMSAGPKGHLIAPRLMAAVYDDVLRRMIRQGWRRPRRRVSSAKIKAAWTLLKLRLAA